MHSKMRQKLTVRPQCVADVPGGLLALEHYQASLLAEAMLDESHLRLQHLVPLPAPLGRQLLGLIDRSGLRFVAPGLRFGF